MKGKKKYTEIAKGKVPKIILWDKRKWVEKVHRMCKLSQKGKTSIRKSNESGKKKKPLVLCLIVGNFDFSLEPKSGLNSIGIVGSNRECDQGKEESEWSSMTEKRK